jgi:hypothetical protein
MTGIIRLQSNLKSPAGEWSVELGQHTLIIGPNGGHKSAIVQAVELALTGAIDDIAGRMGVRDARALLSASSGPTLTATAFLEDDTRARFFVERDEDGKTKKPQRTGAEGSVLPLREICAALSGSMGYKAFFPWVCARIGEDEILDALNQSFHARYLDIQESVGRKLSTPHKLIAVLEYVAKQARVVSAEAKTLDKVLESLRAALPDVVSDDDFATLMSGVLSGDSALNEARSAYSQWVAHALELSRKGALSSEVISSVQGWHDEVSRLEVDSPSVVTDDFIAAIESRTLWSRFDRLNQDSDKASASATEYKEFAKELERVAKSLLFENSLSFVEGVNKFMPQDWVFDLQTEGNLRVGLIRGGTLHTALSGAEWATVTAAVAMAMPRSSAPHVVIPEDRAFDPNTLRSILKSFSSYEGQVLLTAIARPKGRLPKGWTVIDLYNSPLCPEPVVEEEPEPVVEEEAPVEEVAVVPEAALPKPPVRSENNGNTTIRRAAVSTTYGNKILAVLGYTEEDVGKMSRQTLTEVIKDGLLARNVTIQEDGGYAVVESTELPRLG